MTDTAAYLDAMLWTRTGTPAEPTPPTPDPDTIYDRVRGGMFEARLHHGFELIGRAEDDRRRQEP